MSFKQNMLRGLGKCHVEMLESSNREVFRKDILYGALNSLQEKGWITPCGDTKGRKKEYSKRMQIF